MLEPAAKMLKVAKTDEMMRRGVRFMVNFPWYEARQYPAVNAPQVQGDDPLVALLCSRSIIRKQGSFGQPA